MSCLVLLATWMIQIPSVHCFVAPPITITTSFGTSTVSRSGSGAWSYRGEFSSSSSSSSSIVVVKDRRWLHHPVSTWSSKSALNQSSSVGEMDMEMESGGTFDRFKQMGGAGNDAKQNTRLDASSFSVDEQRVVVPSVSSLSHILYDPEAIERVSLTAKRAEVLSLKNEEYKEADRSLFLARLLVLGSAALYGTNFTFVKILGESMPIGAMSMLRFGLASVFTSFWLFGPANTDSSIATDDNSVESDVVMNSIFSGFQIGILFAMGYVGQAVGLETVDAGKSAFICSLAVVVVPILDALVGKRMEGKTVIGILMAIIGVAFLELGDNLGSSDMFTFNLGDWATFVQPVAFGAGFWRLEHAMERFPFEAKRISAASSLAIFLFSAIYCFAGVGGVAPPDLQQVMLWLTDQETFVSLIWTGLITTALTGYMETVALRTLSASETTLLLSTEPLWGAAFACTILGETVGTSAGVGVALILLGIFVTNSKLPFQNFLDRVI
eukprot:CAMPEP_0116074576 /NCGR_PEP_ID=MMETSP0322-20121206/16062_1 /TAXON_ID=163516 /ORGANISM="Leptocylindrus danicus var. apora, Strain B651" /LENGTH=496 /DNA_ID=CAMNT_0003564351 /DNA_START=341 /DNA_END=1831 /DNA_ORIENTATION=+